LFFKKYSGFFKSLQFSGFRARTGFFSVVGDIPTFFRILLIKFQSVNARHRTHTERGVLLQARFQTIFIYFTAKQRHKKKVNALELYFDPNKATNIRHRPDFNKE
jgi:hypothetical protein